MVQLDEATRHEVFSTLHERLGQTTAVVLMSAIPPCAWSDVAMKSDLVAMEQRMDLKLESMEHRLTAALERGIRRALVAQTFMVFGGVVGLYLLAERFGG
jgi:hypothetical protein